MARPRKNADKRADINKTVEISAESTVETVEVPVAEEAETDKKTSERKTTKKTTTAKKQSEKKETTEKITRKSVAKANIFIQYLGTEVSSADLVEKAKTDSGVKSPKTVNIYVKPEENTVYYVVDDKSGSYKLA